MEEGLGRRTHHVPAGARRAAGVSAPASVRHVPGGAMGRAAAAAGRGQFPLPHPEEIRI